MVCPAGSYRRSPPTLERFTSGIRTYPTAVFGANVIRSRTERPDVNYRRLITAIGSGFSTFLVVGATVIELVGGDIGAGIVGVFAGFVAALTAVVVVFVSWLRIDPRLRPLLDGYAAFGLAFFAVWFLRYGHVANLDEYVDVPGQVGIALAAGIAVVLTSWLRESRSGAE